jgi:hypothetical protein
VRPGEVGDAPVAQRQVRQNLTARWIGQRGKSSVQRSRRIFNHLVKYLSKIVTRKYFFVTICGPVVSEPYRGACVKRPSTRRLAQAPLQ